MGAEILIYEYVSSKASEERRFIGLSRDMVESIYVFKLGLYLSESPEELCFSNSSA